MGYEVGNLELPHHERSDGRSSYTLGKLAALAGNTILAHSQTPLRIATIFGLVISVASMLVGFGIAARALIWGAAVTGWTSLIVSIFTVGGIQIFITGVVGIYVGRCFDEAKKRPLYFVKDTINLDRPPINLSTARARPFAGEMTFATE